MLPHISGQYIEAVSSFNNGIFSNISKTIFGISKQISEVYSFLNIKLVIIFFLNDWILVRKVEQRFIARLPY